MPGIIAVLDVNVLFPASLRDTLLRAFEQRLYQAKWTLEILEEMRRNLVKTQKMTEDQSQKLVSALVGNLPRARAVLISSAHSRYDERRKRSPCVSGSS